MKRFILAIAFAFASFATFSIPAFAQKSVVGGPYLQNVTTSSYTVVWATEGLEHPEIHKLSISGLEPGTRYTYTVAGDPSEHYVTTVGDSYDSLRIAVLNDVHSSLSDFERLAAPINDSTYDFVVFNGDMTDFASSREDVWDQYLRSAGEMFADHMPLYLARGNHEWRGDAVDIYQSEFYATPTEHTYYTFSYGKFFFIVLDSGEARNVGAEHPASQYLVEEMEWLRGVLESPECRQAKYRLVFSHIAPLTKLWFPFDRHFGNPDVETRDIVQMLNDAGIDYMVCADLHNHFDIKPGSVGNNFPILINDDRTFLDLRLSTAPDGSVKLDYSTWQ